MTIIVEFPASGMVVTSFELDNIRLFRYQSTSDWVCFAFELFVILYFIYGFVLTELWEIYKRRFAYVTEVWNYYEWAMIVVRLLSLDKKLMEFLDLLCDRWISRQVCGDEWRNGLRASGHCLRKLPNSSLLCVQ
jgi:hypothetical protein